MKRNQDCNRNPLKRKMATYCTIAMFVTLTGIAITICVPMIVSFILDKVMNIFNLYILWIRKYYYCLWLRHLNCFNRWLGRISSCVLKKNYCYHKVDASDLEH